MRARDRIERGIKLIQVALTEEQHRRLKIEAAVSGMAMADLVRQRLSAIIETDYDGYGISENQDN